MAFSWLAADWPAPPGVVAGTTGRDGGHSEQRFASLNTGANVGADAAAVEANRATLMREMSLPAEPVWLRQVHGATVVVDPPAGASPEADAIVCRRPDAVCAVLTADCLPVLFTSTDGRELAAAHAGWRGLDHLDAYR